MADPAVRYLIFDVESVADGELVSQLRYPNEGISPKRAIARYRAELMAKYDSDFIPYSFQVPIAIAVAKVDADLRLLDVVTLDEPEYRPHVMTDLFWRGWQHYRRPTLVTFNGRSFDLPLLELAAFRFGIAVPEWFNIHDKSWDQNRGRYNLHAHFDLHDLLTNFGASRFTGGLNLAANILGKPGKMKVQGYLVQDMFNAGKVSEINDYCRYDTLDTYFVFLRCQVLIGKLSLQREQELIAAAKQWLMDRVDAQPAYALYLDEWGDWTNPWDGPSMFDSYEENEETSADDEMPEEPVEAAYGGEPSGEPGDEAFDEPGDEPI